MSINDPNFANNFNYEIIRFLIAGAVISYETSHALIAKCLEPVMDELKKDNPKQIPVSVGKIKTLSPMPKNFMKCLFFHSKYLMIFSFSAFNLKVYLKIRTTYIQNSGKI